MKNTIFATQEDHQEIETFINVFFNDNPTGIMVLDASNKVLYHNSMIEHIFENDFDAINSTMGNFMKCSYLEDVQVCGTTRKCPNCSIRNAVNNVKEYNCVEKGVQINKTFLLNGKPSVKWLSASFFPFNYQSKRLTVVSMIDTTELVRLRMESDLNSDQANAGQMKHSYEFHDQVIDALSKNIGNSTLIQIEMPETEKTLKAFGTLWKKEFINSLYNYLMALDETDKIICKCESDKFMIFYPESFNNFDFLEAYLIQYENGLVPLKNDFVIKGLHIHITENRLISLLESDSVHLEYFKLLSQLDTSNHLEIKTHNL